jgi:1,4-dihydroxy-2-naphthoate octaprenyltransferase
MKTSIKDFLTLYRPFNLLLAGLAYALGVSMAKYLGIPLMADILLEGALFVLLIVAGSSALNAYFSPVYVFPKTIDDQQERNLLLRLLFVSALVMLGICAMIVFLLVRSGSIVPTALFFIIVYTIIALSVSIPPARFADKGFGEFAEAILVSGLPIIMAFILQAQQVHRMVSYFSFPITLLALVFFLVMDFPRYGADQKYGRQSLLLRLSWQRGITVHNYILAVVFLLLAAAPFFGIPLGVCWPPLLTLPLAIYQTIMLRNISIGMAPNWSILKVNGSALIGLVIYLLAFTFWMQ